jgi:hypothetical protein
LLFPPTVLTNTRWQVQPMLRSMPSKPIYLAYLGKAAHVQL